MSEVKVYVFKYKLENESSYNQQLIIAGTMDCAEAFSQGYKAAKAQQKGWPDKLLITGMTIDELFAKGADNVYELPEVKV